MPKKKTKAPPLPPPAPLPPHGSEEYRAEEQRRRRMFMRVLGELKIRADGRLRRPELELVLEELLASQTKVESELVASVVSDTGDFVLEDLTDEELSYAMVAASLARWTNPYAAADSALAVAAKRLGVLDDPGQPPADDQVKAEPPAAPAKRRKAARS